LTYISNSASIKGGYKLDNLVKRYLIHVHIWNDNIWESVITGYCDLGKLKEYYTEANYKGYPDTFGTPVDD